MPIEELVVDFDAGAGVALRIFDPATGHTFNFLTDVFEANVAGANQKLALTELVASNKGTGLSTYRATFDGSRLHRGPVPKRYSFDLYEGASPAISVLPFVAGEQVVQFGAFGESPVELITTLTPMQAECFSVQLSTVCMCRGKAISMFSGGRAKFTADASGNRINSDAHGRANLEVVCFNTTNTLPGGLSLNTPYYVRNVLTNSFQVSLTPTGSVVDITGTGTGIHVWDNPSVTIAVRPVGSASTAFTKTILLDAYRGYQFEGQQPEGRVCGYITEGALSLTAHGFTNDEPIAFSVSHGGTPPPPLVEGRQYYAATSGNPNAFGVYLDPVAEGGIVFFPFTGELRVYNTPYVLAVGKQYEVTTTLTMSGQTVTQSRSFQIPRGAPHRFSEVTEIRMVDEWSSSGDQLETAIAAIATQIGVTGVVLKNSQPNYAPAKAGDAMTLQSAQKTEIASLIDTYSDKLTAIHAKLPSRAYLTGTTQSSGALAADDLPPQAEKIFWSQNTPRVDGLTPGQAYTWELLSANESQIYAVAGTVGWLNMADPLFDDRYVDGDLTTTVTATAGGAVESILIPIGAFLDGTKLRLRKREGASPALGDPEILPRWQLSRSTSEPITSLSVDVLRQFANVDTGLTDIVDGSICKLAGGDVTRPATDLVLLNTTVQSVVNSKEFVLVGGSNSYDASFDGCQVILYDVSSGEAVSTDQVKSWVASSRTLTIQSAPAFTVTAGDKVLIISSPGVKYQQTGPYVMR